MDEIPKTKLFASNKSPAESANMGLQNASRFGSGISENRHRSGRYKYSSQKGTDFRTVQRETGYATRNSQHHVDRIQVSTEKRNLLCYRTN